MYQRKPSINESKERRLKIIETISNHPQSTKDISSKAGVEETSVRGILYTMFKSGLLEQKYYKTRGRATSKWKWLNDDSKKNAIKSLAGFGSISGMPRNMIQEDAESKILEHIKSSQKEWVTAASIALKYDLPVERIGRFANILAAKGILDTEKRATPVVCESYGKEHVAKKMVRFYKLKGEENDQTN